MPDTRVNLGGSSSGFGEQGKGAFISGEHGNKGKILGEQGNKDNIGEQGT